MYYNSELLKGQDLTSYLFVCSFNFSMGNVRLTHTCSTCLLSQEDTISTSCCTNTFLKWAGAVLDLILGPDPVSVWRLEVTVCSSLGRLDASSLVLTESFCYRNCSPKITNKLLNTKTWHFQSAGLQNSYLVVKIILISFPNSARHKINKW